MTTKTAKGSEVFALRSRGHVMWCVRLYNGTMVKAQWLSKRMALTGAEVEEKRLEARQQEAA